MSDLSQEFLESFTKQNGIREFVEKHGDESDGLLFNFQLAYEVKGLDWLKISMTSVEAARILDANFREAFLQTRQECWLHIASTLTLICVFESAHSSKRRKKP